MTSRTQQLRVRPRRGEDYWAIPESLRLVPSWYLTESTNVPLSDKRFAPMRRYSPVTLLEIISQENDEYSDYYTAYTAFQDHLHWFSGLGFKIRPRFLLLIIRHGFHLSGGSFFKDLRDSLKLLNGYFERGPLIGDIQGILWSQETSRPGIVNLCWH